LLVVAAGALSLLDDKYRDITLHRIVQLSGDARFRALRRAADMLGFATDRRIELISLGALLYAILFGIEGIGLLLQKRWAEYFTAIVTGSFLPLEVYEIFRKPDSFKIGLLAINVVVVLYLIVRIRERG
jgi:uncharacterized membrane protein (DUF2068 family)